MKKYISIWLLLALPACAQRTPLPPLNISVSNHVSFRVEQTSNGTVDVIGFQVTVVNNGEEAIPDLRPDNMFKYSEIYIDGHPSPPFGFYNGPGSDRATDTLSQGESDSFGWGQYMTARDTNPPIITVQWKYLGVRSDILEVDRINKTVKSIEADKLNAEQSGAGYPPQGVGSPDP